MTDQHRQNKENDKTAGTDLQSTTPGGRERLARAADIAHKNHFHAEAAELTQHVNERNNADKGTVFMAPERSADQDEVAGLEKQRDTLPGDHP